jgi:hypothetical protein
MKPSSFVPLFAPHSEPTRSKNLPEAGRSCFFHRFHHREPSPQDSSKEGESVDACSIIGANKSVVVAELRMTI